MKSRAGRNAIAGCLLMAFVVTILRSHVQAQEKSSTPPWPVAEPNAVGLDPTALSALDADIAAGKYGLVDSMLIIRDGKQALARSYAHDYGKIYGELAKHNRPLNHVVSGPQHYFSTQSHPYYQNRDLHTMQSLSKTDTSITLGIDLLLMEFPTDDDPPLL